MTDALNSGGELATAVGTFAVVLWLVKIVVGRTDTAEHHATEALAALEARMTAELSRAVADAEARCDERLDALRTRLDVVSHAVRELASQHPDDERLRVLLATLPNERDGAR